MNVRICPECGGKVASTLTNCPHCGHRMAPVEPPRPIIPEPKPQPKPQPNSIIGDVCPGCGRPFEPSDYSPQGWATCKSCGRSVYTQASKMMSENKERIFVCDTEKNVFHNLCLAKLMEHSPADIFSQIRDISVNLKYVWVAQYNAVGGPILMAMDSWGEKALKVMASSQGIGVPIDLFDKWYPYITMHNYDKSLAKDEEIVAREWTEDECLYRFNRTSGAGKAMRFFCVPIFEERLKYGDKEYTFYGPATANNTDCFFTDIPIEPILIGQPKLVNFKLCQIILAIVALLLAAGIVIGVLSQAGIIWGIISLIIAGIILYMPVAFVAVIVWGLAVGLDKSIGGAINTKRRISYKMKYRNIQNRKQAEAKDMYNLNLTYEVPEY